jgi:hypothetical protein
MTNGTEEILNRIARAIAASHYPYSGPALVCLPDGKQITREEYWNSLNSEKREEYMQYAYASYVTMSDFGIFEIIYSATQDYLDEK